MTPSERKENLLRFARRGKVPPPVARLILADADNEEDAFLHRYVMLLLEYDQMQFAEWVGVDTLEGVRMELAEWLFDGADAARDALVVDTEVDADECRQVPFKTVQEIVFEGERA